MIEHILSDGKYRHLNIEAKETLFSTIIDTYNTILHNIAYRITGDTHLTEEILQEVYINLYTTLERGEKINKIDSWLRRTTINTALNYTQKEKTLQTRHEQIGNMKPSTYTPERPQDILNILENRERIAIILKKYGGYTYKELSQKLGCTEKETRKIIHNALKKLEREINT